jgi:hypothetical protein
MKISKYLGYILKDFLVAYGCLIIVVAIFVAIYSTETINSSLLGQIILIASAYTFFKFALVNKYELGKKAQMINFFICFVLADVMIILWLWFFNSSKIIDKSLLIIFALVILVVKGAVYAMIYIDGQIQAKQLNEKLSVYKRVGSE